MTEHRADDRGAAAERRRSVDTPIGRRNYMKLGLAVVAGAAGVTTGSETLVANVDDPAPVDTEIGGGADYDGHVTPGDADVVVSTRSELLSAFDRAGRDDVIYVDDDAEIDLSEQRVTVPAGVTLASGRGRDGSPGGLISVDRRTSRMLQVYDDDVRITGLRFRGHRVGYFDPSDGVWANASLAVRAYADCEVDNCEFFGWTHAAIGIGQHGSDPIDSAAHVHHCSFHDNMMSGLGYGVVVYRGDPLIEYSYFDRNRHSIAGGGRAGCSYEACYNIQGSTSLLFGFEMHDPGGDEIRIHHNTFELVERRDGRRTPAVAVRGTPETGAWIENNWFYNPRDPGDDRDADGSPVVQYHNDAEGTSWDNVTVAGNHYGEDEPAQHVGHPRGGPETAQLRVYVREEGADDYLEGITVEIAPHNDTDMSGYDGPYEVETVDGEAYFGGYALFEALPVGTYDVYARHPGYEEGAYMDLELDPSGRQPPISIEPREGYDVLTISGCTGPTPYEFTVNGDVKHSTEYGGTIDSDSRIDGTRVAGEADNEPDSFAFTGEISSFDADDTVFVKINGEPLDLSGMTRVISLEGGDDATAINYRFRVTEAVEKSDANDATSDDAVSGTVVTGVLRGECDSYVIPADDRIVEFQAEADIDVIVDETVLSPAEVVDHFR